MKVKYFNNRNRKITFRRKIKRTLCYLYSYNLLPYLLVALHYLFIKKKKFKHTISICLIFKDESPYLKEWLEYHKMIGVDHFYLYNNNSSDSYLEVIEPYVKEGVVTLIDWEKPYSQVEAYNDCYIKFRDETQWLGFIDADEFLNLSLKGGNNLKELFHRYRHFPSLHMFWRIFGTSGLMKEKPDELVIENFTSCWPYLCNVGKGFINNNWNFKQVMLHWNKTEIFKIPVFPIIDNLIFAPYMQVWQYNNYQPRIYINHYWSRSREYSIYKNYKKSDVYSKKLESIKQNNGIDYFELKCSAKDYSIQRWLIFLKNKW